MAALTWFRSRLERKSEVPSDGAGLPRARSSPPWPERRAACRVRRSRRGGALRHRPIAGRGVGPSTGAAHPSSTWPRHEASTRSASRLPMCEPGARACRASPWSWKSRAVGPSSISRRRATSRSRSPTGRTVSRCRSTWRRGTRWRRGSRRDCSTSPMPSSTSAAPDGALHRPMGRQHRAVPARRVLTPAIRVRDAPRGLPAVPEHLAERGEVEPAVAGRD